MTPVKDKHTILNQIKISSYANISNITTKTEVEQPLFRKVDINNFINHCRAQNLGRAYKNLDDIFNIEEYYDNGKSFWIAYINIEDQENPNGQLHIVGTLGLQVKKNKDKNILYGALKRFYVTSNYQYIGIGRKLHDELESCTSINEKGIQIQSICLACGKQLETAHKFYEDHNYIKINSGIISGNTIKDMELHYLSGDDIFIKQIR